MSGIVPRKAVQEIARIVGSGEDVQVAISDNQFILQMPNVLLMARLIEGTFPNYEQVVPKAHPHRIVVSRGALTVGAAPGVGALRGADQAREVHALPGTAQAHRLQPGFRRGRGADRGASTRARR